MLEKTPSPTFSRSDWLSDWIWFFAFILRQRCIFFTLFFLHFILFKREYVVFKRVKHFCCKWLPCFWKEKWSDFKYLRQCFFLSHVCKKGKFILDFCFQLNRKFPKSKLWIFSWRSGSKLPFLTLHFMLKKKKWIYIFYYWIIQYIFFLCITDYCCSISALPVQTSIKRLMSRIGVLFIGVIKERKQ